VMMLFEDDLGGVPSSRFAELITISLSFITNLVAGIFPSACDHPYLCRDILKENPKEKPLPWSWP